MSGIQNTNEMPVEVKTEALDVIVWRVHASSFIENVHNLSDILPGENFFNSTRGALEELKKHFKQYDETIETLQSELIFVKAELEESHKMNSKLGLVGGWFITTLLYQA